MFVVWDSIAMIVIMLAYIVFTSLIGFIIFANNYDDPAEYFKDLPTTIFNIFILFTTSNFPDIIFPFWKVNNFTSIYFIGFLLIGLYMLLNLMLSVFYNSYRR